MPLPVASSQRQPPALDSTPDSRSASKSENSRSHRPLSASSSASSFASCSVSPSRVRRMRGRRRTASLPSVGIGTGALGRRGVLQDNAAHVHASRRTQAYSPLFATEVGDVPAALLGSDVVQRSPHRVHTRSTTSSVSDAAACSWLSLLTGPQCAGGHRVRVYAAPLVGPSSVCSQCNAREAVSDGLQIRPLPSDVSHGACDLVSEHAPKRRAFCRELTPLPQKDSLDLRGTDSHCGAVSDECVFANGSCSQAWLLTACSESPLSPSAAGLFLPIRSVGRRSTRHQTHVPTSSLHRTTPQRTAKFAPPLSIDKSPETCTHCCGRVSVSAHVPASHSHGGSNRVASPAVSDEGIACAGSELDDAYPLLEFSAQDSSTDGFPDVITAVHSLTRYTSAASEAEAEAFAKKYLARRRQPVRRLTRFTEDSASTRRLSSEGSTGCRRSTTLPALADFTLLVPSSSRGGPGTTNATGTSQGEVDEREAAQILFPPTPTSVTDANVNDVSADRDASVGAAALLDPVLLNNEDRPFACFPTPRDRLTAKSVPTGSGAFFPRPQAAGDAGHSPGDIQASDGDATRSPFTSDAQQRHTDKDAAPTVTTESSRQNARLQGGTGNPAATSSEQADCRTFTLIQRFTTNLTRWATAGHATTTAASSYHRSQAAASGDGLSAPFVSDCLPEPSAFPTWLPVHSGSENNDGPCGDAQLPTMSSESVQTKVSDLSKPDRSLTLHVTGNVLGDSRHTTGPVRPLAALLGSHADSANFSWSTLDPRVETPTVRAVRAAASVASTSHRRATVIPSPTVMRRQQSIPAAVLTVSAASLRCPLSRCHASQSGAEDEMMEDRLRRYTACDTLSFGTSDTLDYSESVWD